MGKRSVRENKNVYQLSREAAGLSREAAGERLVFVSPELYRAFVRRGGRISVRQKSSLLAVCVNPVAPNGIVLDSDTLCRELSARIGLPVYDIVKNDYAI